MILRTVTNVTCRKESREDFFFIMRRDSRAALISPSSRQTFQEFPERLKKKRKKADRCSRRWTDDPSMMINRVLERLQTRRRLDTTIFQAASRLLSPRCERRNFTGRSSDCEIYRLSKRNGAKLSHERASKRRGVKAWKVWESCAEKIADFVSHTCSYVPRGACALVHTEPGLLDRLLRVHPRVSRIIGFARVFRHTRP